MQKPHTVRQLLASICNNFLHSEKFLRLHASYQSFRQLTQSTRFVVGKIDCSIRLLCDSDFLHYTLPTSQCQAGTYQWCRLRSQYCLLIMTGTYTVPATKVVKRALCIFHRRTFKLTLFAWKILPLFPQNTKLTKIPHIPRYGMGMSLHSIYVPAGSRYSSEAMHVSTIPNLLSLPQVTWACISFLYMVWIQDTKKRCRSFGMLFSVNGRSTPPFSGNLATGRHGWRLPMKPGLEWHVCPHTVRTLPFLYTGGNSFNVDDATCFYVRWILQRNLHTDDTIGSIRETYMYVGLDHWRE